jgi:site-specific recombinase XerC
MADSWEISLRAARKSPRTIEGYLASVAKFVAFQPEHGRPTDVPASTSSCGSASCTSATCRATVSTHHKGMRAFLNYCVLEDEIELSPMRNVEPPAIPDNPPAVLSIDQVRSLLSACKGKRFEDLRDTAIITMFFDTGMRRAELVGLKVDDVKLKEQIALVLGKGSRRRACPFAAPTAKAVDRYLRARERHQYADAKRCGCASAGRSPRPESARCWNAAVRRRVSTACTVIASGIPSPTSGCRPVVTRAISWRSPDGAADRCCPGTPRARQPNERAVRTDGSARPTSCERLPGDGRGRHEDQGARSCSGSCATGATTGTWPRSSALRSGCYSSIEPSVSRRLPRRRASGCSTMTDRLRTRPPT